MRSCDSSAPSQQSNKAPAVSQPGGRERPGISHFVCMAARRLINSTVFKVWFFFFVFFVSPEVDSDPDLRAFSSCFKAAC